MSDYSRQHDFGAKDLLTTGDPNKLIKGSEVDAEFDAIVTANASKVDEPASPSTSDVLEWSGSVVQWAPRNFTSKLHGIAPASGLHVRNGATATTQARVTADELMVFTSTNSSVLLSSVDETATITGSGANGLDTGAEANDTWYYLYIIYNGSSTDALLSISATAPTMPGGYTHRALVGAVYNDGADFRDFDQIADMAYQDAAALWTDQNPTTPTSIDASAAVPPIARTAMLVCRTDNTGGSASQMTLYANQNYGGFQVQNNGGNTSKSGGMVELPLVTAQTLWADMDAATSRGTISCRGYRL